MSTIEGRLRKLRSLGITRGAEGLRSRPKRRHTLEDQVPGQVVETPSGAYYLVESCFPLSHRQGRRSLGDLLQCPPDAAGHLARDAGIGGLRYDQAVFLDIETSGLAGGTGTVAFMVGVGFYKDDAFQVQQYFMRDYPEEPSLLVGLGGLLDRFDWLVSFNGRAFDLPLLNTRFLMNRMPPRLAGAPHLDLLFPARRLWRGRLPSCRLGMLENQILGFYRDQADVPGYLVPQIYFDYLRTGDAREIGRVFYHNMHDIVSLAALAGHMGHLMYVPQDGNRAGLDEDLCRVAILLEEAGEMERAEDAYRHVVAAPIAPDVREEALRRLALLYKRLDRREEAREIWHALREAQYGADVTSLIELAKDYEHRTKEFDKAADCVRDALERVARWQPGPHRRRALAELEYRMARIQRKRAAGTAPRDDQDIDRI